MLPNGTGGDPTLLGIDSNGWVAPTDDYDGFYYYDYDPRSSDFLFTRYFTAVFDVLVDAEQDKASTRHPRTQPRPRAMNGWFQTSPSGT